MPNRTVRRVAIAAAVSAGVAALSLLINAPGLADASPAPAATPAARPAVSAATTYTVDPVHTAIVFGIEWGEMSPFYGQFNAASGTVTYDGSDPASFACEISVAVESVDTHNDQRDRHLKSPDFFNAREFPNITFKSTGLTKGDDGTYTLKGDLSLHGQTRAVEAKVSKLSAKQMQQAGNRCGFGAELTIKRSDFGVGAPGGVGDEVRLMIGVQSVAQ